MCGEPVFLPRSDSDAADEDDGYVIVQVFRHLKKESEKRNEFCILDAKNIHKGPIAILKLPFHLPYGFHGTFTRSVL